MARRGPAPVTATPPLTWRRVPSTLRALALWLTIVQAVGYTTSLLFVHHTTGMTPVGVAAHYRGADTTATDAAMEFPKTYSEMLTITHTHLLAMAAIFTFSGFALALCERPSDRWRRALIVEPFVALLVSFASMWLMRYVGAGFSWLLSASSALMALTFYIQTWLILRELLPRQRS